MTINKNMVDLSPNIEIALKRMGYRHLGYNVYGKPIANQIYIAKKNKSKWIVFNNFMGHDGKIHTWAYKEFENEETLKTAEYSINHMVNYGTSTNFGFLTTKELFEEKL